MSDTKTISEIQKHIEREKEYCSRNYAYTIKKYFKITHPKRGKIPFDLYDFQEKVLNDLIDHRYVVINKGRQLGLSTLTAAYSLVNMLFNEEFKILVIATTQDTAKNLVQKVKLAYDNSPVWLKNSVKVQNDNIMSLVFDNGSSIKATSASAHAGRSEALSLLIIDEFAHIEKISDIWVSAQSTLAEGGDAVLLSTPNGVGNEFHKIWQKATNGEAPEGLETFHPIELPWYLHPNRDQKWRDAETYKLGKRKAAQENDCDFLASGHTVIEGEILKYYKENEVNDPISKQGPANNLWTWARPNYSKTYIISADVARGDGSDNSTFHIIESETLTQVGEFKAKIGTREFARLLVSTAIEWNDALLVIDNRNIGWDVISEVIALNYENLFWSYKDDLYVDEEVQLMKNYDLKRKEDMTPGFTTNSRNRPLIISKLEELIRHKEVKINSKRLISELEVFVWKNSKPQAQDGYNDDLVMAFGYALYLNNTALRLKKAGEKLTRKALQHAHKHAYKGGSSKKDPWKVKDSHGETQDLRWLL